MAKTIEDRITRLEVKVDELSKLLKASSLKKMKRQIVGLKAKGRKLAKDVEPIEEELVGLASF